MDFISERNLKSNIRRFNFKDADKEVFAFLNNAIYRFAYNEFARYAKKSELIGGRVVLPLEYFGVDSGRYVHQEGPFTNMAITADTIRPEMKISGLEGGAPDEFTVSIKDCTSLFKSIVGDVKVHKRLEIIKCFKTRLDAAMTKLFLSVRKANKKEEILSVEMLKAKLTKKFI